MDTGLRIMIIEDDAALARELGGFLEKWQYETVMAERFDDILQEFMEKRPQIVLMDINLPCHDGFYWCSRLRQVSKVPSSTSAAAVMTGIKSWQSRRAVMIMWKNRSVWSC